MVTEEIVKEANKKEKGKMIVFISGKGGVGKTILSVNTAVVLNEKGFETCIMDGSFQFGDVNLALDIHPSVTITELVNDSKLMDSVDVDKYLHTHDSGLKILAAPLKPEFADLITPSAITAICADILKKNDFLVVDLPAGLCDRNLSFLELADKIYLITDLEMASLKNTKVMLRTLKMLDFRDQVTVLLNKSGAESIIKTNDVQDMLEEDKILCISYNPKVVSRSFNIGIPFVISKPGEKITSEVIALTEDFNDNKPKKSKIRRRKRKKQGILEIFKR